jgi:hypothetical protein
LACSTPKQAALTQIETSLLQHDLCLREGEMQQHQAQAAALHMPVHILDLQGT